jgi:hypothetical protein
MRIPNLLLGVVYALFTWFQINDPDALFWVFLYTGLTVISVLNEPGSRSRWPLAGLVFCLAGALRYAPGLLAFLTNDDGMGLAQGMSYEYPYIEEAREFGGMLLSGLGMWWLWRQAEAPAKA